MKNTANKKKLLAIGEALIDFLPDESGVSLDKVRGFLPKVGGAPANVCGAFSKLGGESRMITQLGMDAFGDKILREFQQWNIGCEYIMRTEKANTSLAFVALKEDGQREFSFYRKPGADMLFRAEDLQKEWFREGYALHFCSVSLGDFPMREAHEKAISYARDKRMLISFDPNLRPALWENDEAMIEAVHKFLPYADIVKISEEELELITREKNMEAGLNFLFQGNVKLVIFTEGSHGASAFTRGTKASVPGIKVEAVDTTGAGDGFIGAFLYCLCQDRVSVNEIEQLSEEKMQEYLSFANAFSALSVERKGAIESYPDKERVLDLNIIKI